MAEEAISAPPSASESAPTAAPVLAPFNPTAADAMEHALALVKVQKDDVVWDLGCGDGRWLVAACADSGASGVGVELDATLAARARSAVEAAGLSERVRIVCGDACAADFSAATVLLLYLVPKGLAALAPALEARAAAPPPLRVVANFFSVPGWTPVASHVDARCRLHYYEVGLPAPAAAAPAAAAGSP